MKLLLVLFVVATYYSSHLDAASISSERLLHGLLPRNFLRPERSTEEQDASGEKRTCYNSPCGWAVYHPTTRNIEYYMKNTCECPDDSYKCVRYREDLSASAYVYRCRQNTTANDIVLEDETH
ncbi:uncharacterized protein LOC109852826 isoform X2 [Pseudomyrmex gracilis]|uniref:uncharacterized protein LOC109852826 isoform X2 n=1 Tax=Pseudomyrmex gracilis TaxID=219809 RepID=UPI0009949974|nr:uncharacterized protein LOC109852826 isoform X2 [Pseudomyrmex gracilis]